MAKIDRVVIHGTTVCKVSPTL